MIKAREYQIEAFNKFKDNNWNGILEMATGTGKTITSLFIASRYREERGRVFLIILVPFTHLIDQWEETCNLLGFNRVLKCFGLKVNWKNKLRQKVRDFNIDVSKTEVIISTYRTAASNEFNEIIGSIDNDGFIIGDECHYFGVKGLRKHNFNNLNARLGLSATPDRWWDENGTEFLKMYFGKTVYEYDMKRAIENGILTEYMYNPIAVDLSPNETKKYEQLTKMLINKLNAKKIDHEEISEINRKRSLILSRAEQKQAILFDIFRKKKVDEVSHTLIYCAPGQINDITLELSGMGYLVHRFDSNVSREERMKVLEAFEEGRIQILVAIKCLDEGVDVPSTKTAYFLASTSNPREFIQRRGRILRKSEGKNLAEIYDFIVLPSEVSDNMFKSIASKELPRFAEFSKYAINRFQARDKIIGILSTYGIEHLMDKLPWEVYEELKEMREEL